MRSAQVLVRSVVRQVLVHQLKSNFQKLFMSSLFKISLLKKNKTAPDSALPALDKLKTVQESWQKALKPAYPKNTPADVEVGREEFSSDLFDLLEQISPTAVDIFKITLGSSFKKTRLACGVDATIATIVRAGKAANGKDILRKGDMGKRHSDYGVKPEHLEAFSQAVIATVNQRIGFEDVTPELAEAWKAFFAFVVNVMTEGM